MSSLGKEWQGFCHEDFLLFFYEVDGMERTMWQITLLEIDQKMSEWLVEITFIGELKL